MEIVQCHVSFRGCTTKYSHGFSEHPSIHTIFRFVLFIFNIFEDVAAHDDMYTETLR